MKQMEKIRVVKDQLPHLKAVIQTQPPYAQFMNKADGYWRWDELETMSTDEVEDEYKQRLAKVAANECCCLVYTSGTVGKAKGVMLSHDNINYDINRFINRFQYQQGNERIVSYLPLSHVAAQMAELFFPLAIAATVHFADKDAMKGTLVQTLTKARPTFFLGVPRVFEKIQEKMMSVAAQSGALKKVVGSWAKGVVLQHHMDRMSGRPSNSLQYKLAGKLVIAKVKTALGFQDCRILLTGAAPMAVETKKYFMSLDMPILDGELFVILGNSKLY